MDDFVHSEKKKPLLNARILMTTSKLSKSCNKITTKHHKSNYKQKLSQMMLQVECFSAQRNIICRYQALEIIDNYTKIFDLFGMKVFETIVRAIQA